MFDGLMKGKLYSKCKSSLKQTRIRIEMIKKKRNVIQKYLRNDIAELLKNGLDIHAYGRAEGLILEMERSECYEFIEEYCEHTSNYLATINQERQCPQECKEAVASLMFAAAGFADLPELRRLRSQFSERHGNSLDCHVNKEFAKKVKSPLPSREMKLQLLQSIAAESGLEWNAKALDNKLYNESSCARNVAKESSDGEYGSFQSKDCTYAQHERMTVEDARGCYPERKGHPVKDIPVDSTWRTEMHNELASVRNVTREEKHENKPLKYSSIPPPYTKPEVDKPDISLRDARSDFSRENEKSLKPFNAEQYRGREDSAGNAKKIPKSVRRRFRKPPPDQETAGGSEADDKDKLKDKNKENADLDQRILKFLNNGEYDQPDDEEKVMNKLLDHYSRKGSHRKGTLEPVLDPAYRRVPSDSSTETKEINGDGPNRVSTGSPLENYQRHIRASSFQPDLVNAKSHVHPRLPDYDDFVARLAALRANETH